MNKLAQARLIVATDIAHNRAGTYLIAPYLRGELDTSEAMVNALASLNEPDDEAAAALKFARQEADRNGTLRNQLDRYISIERRNYEAVKRIRDKMIAEGYYRGSYFGVRQPDVSPGVDIADSKYTPPLKLIEQFITHLLERIAKQ